MQHHLPLPPPLHAHIPTPLWRDSKERVLREIQESKSKLAINVSDFEDELESKPLGIIVKSDIFRPKEMISMSGIRETNEVEGTYSTVH
jgi:CDP-glycerol glycerophosphotransferase (TagB/SpsB family)